MTLLIETAVFVKTGGRIPFLQLAAEEKDSKNGAARNFFGPSYFVTALAALVIFVIKLKGVCPLLLPLSKRHIC